MNKTLAVLSYPNSNNLGDFIQSEAVKQYFKNQNYWRGETETNSLTEHSFLYYAQQFQTNMEQKFQLLNI